MKAQITPKQPAPVIIHKTVIIDGKQVKRVHGNHVYSHVRGIVPGDTVSAGLIINGVLQAESVTFPWVATALPGKYPRASVKLLVGDDCKSDTFDTAEVEP